MWTMDLASRWLSSSFAQDRKFTQNREGKPQMAGWVLGHQIRLASPGTRDTGNSAWRRVGM